MRQAIFFIAIVIFLKGFFAFIAFENTETAYIAEQCPLQIDPETGLVQNATFLLSPNHDERPDPHDVRIVVIHGISLPPGKFGSNDIIDLFMNTLPVEKDPQYKDLALLKVSTHFFIRRTGELWQFVPLHHRAWHAGCSEYKGQEHCNDFSVGIELEGTDNRPYTREQYHTLVPLSQALLAHYPQMSAEHIVGHSDIAPGRKSDPGPHFNWKRFKKALKIVTD